MEIIERAEGIFEVTLHDKEKEVAEIRIHIVKGKPGKRSLMVDAGFGNEESLRDMEEALSSLGISYDALDIFLTHKHHDHCGLASAFAKKGARLFMNPEEERHSYDCLYVQTSEDSQREQKEVLKSVGISEEWTPKLWKRFMELNDWVAKKREPWVYIIQKYPYIPVKEGQTFSYGDYDFWVIPLRGHTYGQMGLYDAKHRIAFTADQVLEGVTPIVGTTHANEHLLELYFQSLSWIKRELGDCLILPGHNGPIEHVAPVVDQIVYSYIKKMDQVKKVITDGDSPKTVWQTAKAVYRIREIPEDGEAFIVMKSMISKTFSCLEYLSAQEMIKREFIDGRLCYGGNLK